MSHEVYLRNAESGFEPGTAEVASEQEFTEAYEALCGDGQLAIEAAPLCLRTVPINDIKLGARIRQDYGDIDEMAASVGQTAILQPIGVDSENNLVIGGRRLRSYQKLGLTEVPVLDYGTLTPLQRLRFELEENQKRKDLTAAEHSEFVVAWKRLALEAIATEEASAHQNGSEPSGDFCGTSPQKSKAKRGRPKKQDATRKVASRTGVSPRTLGRAEKHQEAIKAYTFLGAPDWSQDQALSAAAMLKKLTREEHDAMVGFLTEPGVPSDLATTALQTMTEKLLPSDREKVVRQLTSSDDRQRGLAKNLLVDRPPPPDPRRVALMNCCDIIRRCINTYPKDPLVVRFQAVIDVLQDLIGAVVGQEEERRRE